MPKCMKCGAKITKEQREIQEVSSTVNQSIFQKLKEADKLLLCRAGRLLKKGKPFAVVACDEPYYLDVYRLIRQHEKAKGTWSEYDEKCFMDAVNQPVDTLIRWKQKYLGELK